jgi:hypothetical protein
MEVTFLRTGERRYAIIARPDGRPPVTMNPAPGFDPRIPHDLIHYAVEREFAIERGVFGQLAAGGDVKSFWRLDGMGDRRLRRRGQHLVRTYGHELARSEQIAGRINQAWLRAARPLEDERLERVCEQLDELSAAWQAVGIGAEMTLTWEEAAHAPRPPARAPRRSARRVRPGARRAA